MPLVGILDFIQSSRQEKAERGGKVCGVGGEKFFTAGEVNH